jgi:hypothetical protein
MNKNIIFLFLVFNLLSILVKSKENIIHGFNQIDILNIQDKKETCLKFKHSNSSEINYVSRKLVLSNDWETGVNLRTVNGEVPWVPCPIGHYRIIKNKKLNHRVEGCIKCPAGRYGSTIGLTSSFCSGPCPKGRYGDFKGASSPDDCSLCPLDSFGASEGLTSPTCSGKCPIGTYNPNFGSTKFSDCIKCPPNYFGNQCSNQLDFDTEIGLITNKNYDNLPISRIDKYQSSSTINKNTKNTKQINGCGGLNNVCKNQHIAVSFI